MGAKPIRAEVMEFATIHAERPEPHLVTEHTLWLTFRARVLTDDGEMVEYVTEALPFHPVPKPVAP